MEVTDPAVRLEMCSVAGCASLAQRFRLPRDPERRLDWVQFLATANEQQFKESSWRDFRVCCNHFSEECFENLISSRLEASGKVRLTLKPDAVPSVGVQLDGGQSKEQVSPTAKPVYFRHDNQTANKNSSCLHKFEHAVMLC